MPASSGATPCSMASAFIPADSSGVKFAGSASADARTSMSGIGFGPIVTFSGYDDGDMTTEAQQTPPDPGMIFQAMNAWQFSFALKGAIELDLFTAIAEGANTAAPLAARCQASEKGIRVLCDYLTVAGFLGKEGSVYSLPQNTAVFLNRKSPAF